MSQLDVRALYCFGVHPKEVSGTERQLLLSRGEQFRRSCAAGEFVRPGRGQGRRWNSDACGRRELLAEVIDSLAEVDAREVSVSYGSHRLALDQVSIQAGHGVLGLLGPNGAGKSTLLSVLATVLRPNAGSVFVSGHDIQTRTGRKAARARLGWLPQRFDLAGGMTALETVAYAAWANGCDARAARDQATDALGRVDMADLAFTRVRRLSGGQRQRLGLAAAMAHDPSVLLLDEPTVGLDPEQRVKFRASIRAAANRRTVVLSSHLLEDIAQVCDQVAVLNHGRLRFSGTPTELAHLATGDLAPAGGDLTSPLEAGYLRALRSDDEE